MCTQTDLQTVFRLNANSKDRQECVEAFTLQVVNVFLTGRWGGDSESSYVYTSLSKKEKKTKHLVGNGRWVSWGQRTTALQMREGQRPNQAPCAGYMRGSLRARGQRMSGWKTCTDVWVPWPRRLPPIPTPVP